MNGVELLIVAASGLGAGALAGLFGVGGGFLIVPILGAVLDMPASVIVGSTGCAVLGPATTSLLTRRTRVDDWRFPLTIFAGLMVGVVTGANLLDKIAAANPEAVEPSVLLVYCVLLSSLGLWTMFDVLRAERGLRRMPQGWLRFAWIGPVARIENRGQLEATISVPIAVVSSVGVGTLCGLLGISGGLVTVPLFTYGFGLRMRVAVRLSLITVFLASIQSTVVHAWLDHVHLPTVIALLVGGTVGARVTTVYSRKLKPIVLRAGFAGLLLASAVFVFARLMNR